MGDLVARVPALSFIDLRKVLVFARGGRTTTDGTFATCHCVNQPASEPTHYSWRDRKGRLVKRSEWFVARSPIVQIEGSRIDYLISFSLPRFCNQTLERSRKHELYSRCQRRDPTSPRRRLGSSKPCEDDPMLAKLDTIVHELYHIDPGQAGIRRLERADGGFSAHSHGAAFYREVARMASEYLESDPEPGLVEFLRYDAHDLVARYGEVLGTTFRTFPSYPQRYFEPLVQQPLLDADVPVVPLKRSARRCQFSERDLETRRFLPGRGSCLVARADEPPGAEIAGAPVL